MIGLILLGALAVYVIAVFFITLAGAYIGRGAKKSRRGALIGGGLAFLLAIAPMTWDTIPTIIAYRENCSKAGLTVFKDVERWKRENPGVEKTVTRKKGNSLYDYEEKIETDGTRIRILNSRFSYISRSDVATFSAVGTHELIDVLKNEKLIRWQVVGTGKGELRLYNRIDGLDDFKFWLNFETCENQQSKFSEFLNTFKSIGVEND